MTQNLQGIDYTYTIDGKLKAFNQADLDIAKDPGKDGQQGAGGFLRDQFAMEIDYHIGDYTKAGSHIQSGPSLGAAERYNGIIKSTRWNIRNGYQNATQHEAYQYTYDKLGQLKHAHYGTYTPANQVFTASNANKEYDIDYDIIGNIKTLKRTDGNGTLSDNFTYNYQAQNSRLTSVSNNGGSAGYSLALSYNSVGNVVSMQKPGKPLQHLHYNAIGLTAAITKQSIGTEPFVKYYYNERGHRMRKESYNPSTHTLVQTTYYARDIGGNLLSVYEKYEAEDLPISQTELYIYGASHLGVMHKSQDHGPVGPPGDEIDPPIASLRDGLGLYSNTLYYLKDHLGNVRATLLRDQHIQPGLLNYAFITLLACA